MKGFIKFLLGLVLGFAIAWAIDNFKKTDEIALTSTTTTVETSYELADFDAVKVSGTFNAVISHGEYGVTVQVPEEILPYVKVEVKDGALNVGLNGRVKINPKVSKCKAFVYLPELHSIAASGAASVLAADFTGSEVTVRSSGAADIELGGDLAKLEIVSSGASSVSLKGLAENVQVTASGAAGVSLNGEGTSLKVSASGASSVDADDFKVENVSVDASGASKVTYEPAETESVRTSGSAKAEKR